MKCLKIVAMVALLLPAPSILKADIPALFNYSTAGKCRVVNIGRAPSSPVLPRSTNSPGTTFNKNLQWFNSAISSAKASQRHAARVAEELVALAQKSAFTQLDWSGSGSSPAHWQSNLLKNVAIAVNVLDHRRAWSGTQRAQVIKWGNTLYKNSHYSRWGRKQSDRWPDTIATAAAAYMMWGATAPNRKAYNEGKRDFRKVAKLIKTSGGTQEYFVKMSKYSKSMASRGWNARIEDKVLGDLVMAAHVGRRMGENLFTKGGGRVGLYHGIVGWQNTLFGAGGSAVKGMDLSFLTTSGSERSWSWTEYFVANFPNDAATTPLRNRSRHIAQRSRFGFVGHATGPSTCLLR